MKIRHLIPNLFLAVFCTVSAQTNNAPANTNTLQSKWDDNLLNVDLHNVIIKPASSDNDKPQIINAWRQITEKYLIRANIYLDLDHPMPATRFAFNKKKTTGKELLDALIAAFPTYTYIHDVKTGVIWVYPKVMNYDDILSNKVEIVRHELQVPMYSDVLYPLCILSNPRVKIDLDPSQGTGEYSGDIYYSRWNNSVDLPAGLYSVRDVLNICCIATPNLAFSYEVGTGAFHKTFATLTPYNLTYSNPSALEREAAIEYWKIEVNNTTNKPPSHDAIAAAVSSKNPRTRWAAREYVKATPDLSYGIISPDPIINVWETLSWKTIAAVGRGDYPFLKSDRRFADKHPPILDTLMTVDPGLVLITSMELARERKDPSALDIVAGYKFSMEEIAIIKPDVIRIARESKLVRDKLMSMKYDDPDLSPEGLHELENTNLFRFDPTLMEVTPISSPPKKT